MNKQTKGHSIAKINAQAGVLELSITGVIYYGWTASDFRYEVDKALKQGITTATVYLLGALCMKHLKLLFSSSE